MYPFRDLATVRQLADLTQSGVELTSIMVGLREVRNWMPEGPVANVRFEVQGRPLALVTGGRTSAPNEQFELDLNDACEDPGEFFDAALDAEEMGNLV